jgi:hypothetical protein
MLQVQMRLVMGMMFSFSFGVNRANTYIVIKLISTQPRAERIRLFAVLCHALLHLGASARTARFIETDMLQRICGTAPCFTKPGESGVPR